MAHFLLGDVWQIRGTAKLHQSKPDGTGMKIAVAILALAGFLAVSAPAQAQLNPGRFFARKAAAPAKPGEAQPQKNAGEDDGDGEAMEEAPEPTDPEIVK